MRLLGYIMDYAENNKRAFELYQRAATLGDDESAYRLAVLYHQGEGTEKDYSKAMQWLKQSASNGHPKSLEAMGSAYEHGEYNVQQDYEEALKWYLKAKDAGINVKAHIKRVRDAIKNQKAALAKNADKAATKPQEKTPEMLEIEAMLSAWAESWIKGDVDGVLSHYASTFVTPVGTAREVWENKQRKSITEERPINISLHDFKTKVSRNKERAQVKFMQKQGTSEANMKELKRFFRLIRENGQWRIQTAR